MNKYQSISMSNKVKQRSLTYKGYFYASKILNPENPISETELIPKTPQEFRKQSVESYEFGKERTDTYE